RAHVIRIDRQRLFVPDLGKVVVAELAVGVADVVGDFCAVVVAERLEGGDAFLIFAVEHQRAGGAVTVDELLLLKLGALVFLFLLAALPIAVLIAGLWAAGLGLGRSPRLGIAGGEHRAEENRKSEQHGGGEGAEVAGAALNHGGLRLVWSDDLTS